MVVLVRCWAFQLLLVATLAATAGAAVVGAIGAAAASAAGDAAALEGAAATRTEPEGQGTAFGTTRGRAFRCSLRLNTSLFDELRRCVQCLQHGQGRQEEALVFERQPAATEAKHSSSDK